MIDYTALCCSVELRELMKPARGKLPLLTPSAQVHDEWFAHGFSIERRLCVLFLHRRTGYSMMAIAQSPDSIRQLNKLFTTTIMRQLNAERIASEKQQHILSTWQAVGYRTSNDKRMSAAINDKQRLYRLAIDRDGGVLRCDIDRVNCVINRLLHNDDCAAQSFANHFRVSLPTHEFDLSALPFQAADIDCAEISPR